MANKNSSTSSTSTEENWDVESDKEIKQDITLDNDACSPKVDVPVESSGEVRFLDEEYNITAKFLGKYDFEQIKCFILKLHEDNEELKKPIHMIIELYEKHFNEKISKLVEENSTMKNELFEANKNLTILERNGAQIDKLLNDNHLLKLEIKNNQEICRKLERRYRTQEQDFRNNVNDLMARMETLYKEKEQLVIKLQKLQAEAKQLALELGYTDEKCCAIWKSVMPCEKIKAIPKNELLKHLSVCRTLILNLENPCYLEKYRNEDLLNWFDLSDSMSEVTCDLQVMHNEICYLKKLIHKEKLTELVRNDVIMKIKGHFEEIMKYSALIINKQPIPALQESPGEKEQRLLDELNYLKNELRIKDELLHMKDAEIGELRINMDTFNKRADEVDILKHQLKLFEEDFLLEKEAKESLAAEKESLKHELNEARHRSQSVEHKVDSYKNSQEFEVWESPTDVVAVQSGPDRHACIMANCNKTFNSADELQEHVNDCLGQQ